MFSGTWQLQKQADGSYFIDRDGTHFRYIINYLRGQQVSIPSDDTIKSELLEEVAFYNLEGLYQHLDASYIESNIITKQMADSLCTWMPFTRPTLVYSVRTIILRFF